MGISEALRRELIRARQAEQGVVAVARRSYLKRGLASGCCADSTKNEAQASACEDAPERCRRHARLEALWCFHQSRPDGCSPSLRVASDVSEDHSASRNGAFAKWKGNVWQVRHSFGDYYKVRLSIDHIVVTSRRFLSRAAAVQALLRLRTAMVTAAMNGGNAEECLRSIATAASAEHGEDLGVTFQAVLDARKQVASTGGPTSAR